MDAVGYVRGPRPKEFSASRRDSVRKQRPPVVTDEIDGCVERLEFSDEPIGVVVLGGSESLWTGTAESRDRKCDGLFIELCAHLVPESGCFRNTVKENDYSRTVHTKPLPLPGFASGRSVEL
jgi:hypothetical protein